MFIRAVGAVGSAACLHHEGRPFEPDTAHQVPLAQLDSAAGS